MIIKSLVITCLLIVAATFIARWAVGKYTPEAESLYQGGDTLKTCPDSPNCMSTSYSDDSHHIPAITGDEQVFETLKNLVMTEDNTTVISNTDNYLHAEFRSKLLNYVDDLELLHISGSKQIQVRSASRLGKSDFGVNKNRIQALLHKLQGKM